VSGVGSLTSDDIVVLPATKYLLSAYYRIVTGSGSSKSQGVRVDWYDDSRVLLESTNLDCIGNTSGTWTAAGLEVTSPNAAVYARVVVGRFNIQGSTDFQLDSVKFDRKVYIPSGTVSMDDVADGPTTYARPKLEFMENGVIKAVLRGAGTVATDFLFKKTNIADPDTLDGVPNGTTYGRPKLDALTAGGYPDMDKVVDGTTYARIKGTMLTNGEVTSLSRGGSVYATSTFFQKALDSLDNVLDGATYGRPKLDGLNASGYPLLDKVVDGTLFRKVGVNYVNASNQITAIRNTTTNVDVPGTAVFDKTNNNLGDIANGGGFSKVNATSVTGGEITSLSRGGTVYATSTFFQKALDNLDNVTDGTTYGRPKLDGLNASGYPLLDKVVDGTLFRKVGVGYVNASGQITAIRNTTTNADISGPNVFNKAADTLDNVTDGASYRRVGASYVDSSNRVTGVFDGVSAAIAGSNIFRKSGDTLDNVADGSSFRRVSTSYVDASNRISSVFNGTSAVAGSNLFNKSADTLDNVSNGTSFARVSASTVDSGVVSSIRYGAGVTVSTVNLFRKGTDTLDSVVDSASFRKVSATYVNASNQITTVRRSGADESVDNLFKKSSDTFASVAGTLSDGQLGSNVVNTSNIKTAAVTYSKLDDGSPFMAWDEGRGHFFSDRVTYVNGGTKNTPEVNQGYTQFTPTAGTTDFYIETDVQFRTGKERHVAISYRTVGTTGWSSSSTMVVLNMSNTAQSATATMFADGDWHTAIFDISAWTGTSTIRFDMQDGGAAITAGASILISSVATGVIGVGAGNGYTAINYRGGFGVNVAKPLSRLSIVGSSAAEVGDGITGIAQFSTGTGINTDEKIQIGVVNGSYSWIQAIKPGTAYRNLVLNPNGGNVGFGATSLAARLHVASSATAGTGAAIADFRDISNGQRITIVDETTTGSKPPGIKSPVAAFGLGLYSVNGPMILHVGGSDQERLRLDSAGAVYTPNTGSLGVGSGRWTSNGNDIFLNTNGSSAVYLRPGGSGSTNWQYELTAASSYHRWLGASGAELARLNGTGLSIGTGGAAGWKLDLGHGSLGTTLGSTIYAISNYATTSNADYLRTFLYRSVGGGSSWTSADWYVERSVDTTTMGSVKYAGDGSIALAYNRVAKVRVFNDGWVYFDGFNGGGTTTASLDNAGKLIRTASDARLKESLEPVENGLESVSLMEPVFFMWKDRKASGERRDIGLLAQDVRMLVPEAVSMNPDNTLALDYTKLVPVLVSAIKELESRIKRLEAAQA